MLPFGLKKTPSEKVFVPQTTIKTYKIDLNDLVGIWKTGVEMIEFLKSSIRLTLQVAVCLKVFFPKCGS